jgi:hypothetical protein
MHIHHKLLGLMLIAFPMLCAAQQSLSSTNRFQSTLSQYCVTCHNDVLKTAGLSLQNINISNVSEHGETLEKILRKLRGRTMPPSGMPRPEVSVYEELVSYLESELDKHAMENPFPGMPSMRRINRTEYTNAVRDLLALEVNGESLLPPDDTMFGFDNIGTVLTLSPVLAEQYISAARKIRHLAIGDIGMQPVDELYTVSTTTKQEDRMSEELAFGTRGGMAINHHFPLAGEYEIQVLLQKNSRDYIRGLQDFPHQLDIRLDGKRLELFSVGGEVKGKSAGIFSTAAQGDVEQEAYERYFDTTLNVRFPAEAGNQKITVAFLQDTAIDETPLYPEPTHYDHAQYKGGNPEVRSVSVGGPFNATGINETASRNKIFVCQPKNLNDDECARNILTNLAKRAYRSTPGKVEMDDLMYFFKQGQAEGSFEEGIGLAIERILAGPEFLFLVEDLPANLAQGEIFSISDHELATRMSLFLWSSFPDDTLLNLAESGKLKNNNIVKQQLYRMLEDPRAYALIDNFASQWLNLGRLNASDPDADLFPYFTDNLRQAFQMETKLFIEYILKEDRPLLELLNADYTFVNEVLAKHYDIPDIHGSHFRKVSLPDPTRGGLLGQGSILTVTSYANRTAPTIRGKWVLENILSSPPPPPPPNIPGLRDKNDEGEVLSMRAQMELHRGNPVCASCHKVMDPLGFALENYDGIGKWRTVDAASSSPIDASGELPDSTPFVGPSGLRQVLLEQRSYDFVLTVVEKLLTYALGREVEHTDAAVMRTIIRQAASEEYRLSSLINAIVGSTPFQMRRATRHDDI